MMLFVRFRRATKEIELKFPKEDFVGLYDRLKGTLAQFDANKDIDLQKMVISKFIKYLFTNYAKLALL